MTDPFERHFEPVKAVMVHPNDQYHHVVVRSLDTESLIVRMPGTDELLQFFLRDGTWARPDGTRLISMDEFEVWRNGGELVKPIWDPEKEVSEEGNVENLTVAQRIRVLKSIQTRWLADLLAVRQLKLSTGMDLMLANTIKHLDSTIEALESSK